MTLGYIGLGRMGAAMTRNLLEKKYTIVAYDVNRIAVQTSVRHGAHGAHSVENLVSQLPKSRIIWIMVPSQFVDNVLDELTPFLHRGDIIIDGGNSFYEYSMARYKKLKKNGIIFLDCGTSGGVEGARHGACMMIGGDQKAFKKTEKIFRDACVKKGYGYMGASGAGHFVKMVHNGIEYGMMGAIAEGFLAIEKHQKKFKTDLAEVAKVYAHGSIIDGNLMDWLHSAFDKKGYLDDIACAVPKGETEDEMKLLEKLSDMPVLHQARKMRVDTRKGTVCGKLIAALRNQFGGHSVKKQKS